MGNMVSNERGATGTGTSTAIPTRTNQKKASAQAVQPPPLWNESSNKQSFHLDSPGSDLSNPSQFRHRHRHTVSNSNIHGQAQTPLRLRRRASKVVSKSHIATMESSLPYGDYSKRTSLPPPSQFYFGAGFGNVDNASASFLEDRDEQDLLDPSAPEMAVFRRFRLAANTAGVGRMEEDAARRREQILTSRQQRKIWFKSRRKALQQKARRAKTMLSACWEERRGMCIVIPDVQHPQDGRPEAASYPPHVAVDSITTDPLRRVSSTSRRVSEEPPIVDGTGPMQFDPPQVRVLDENQQSRNFDSFYDELTVTAAPFAPVWKETKQPKHDEHSRVPVAAEVPFYLYDPQRILEGIVDSSESPTTATTSTKLQQSRRRTSARYVDRSASPVVALFSDDDEDQYDRVGDDDYTTKSIETSDKYKTKKDDDNDTNKTPSSSKTLSNRSSPFDEDSVSQEPAETPNDENASVATPSTVQDQPTAVRRSSTLSCLDRESIEANVQQQIDQQQKGVAVTQKHQTRHRPSLAERAEDLGSYGSDPPQTKARAVTQATKKGDAPLDQATTRVTAPESRKPVVGHTSTASIRVARTSESTEPIQTAHAVAAKKSGKVESVQPKPAKTVQPQESRQSSSSQNLPILLQLAGWKAPSATTNKGQRNSNGSNASTSTAAGVAKQPNNIPILLQLAGWKTENTKDKQGIQRLTLTENQLSQGPPGRRSNVMATRTVAPTRRRQSAPPLSAVAKDGNRASNRESSASEPIFRKGTTSQIQKENQGQNIATILQQTYPIATALSMDAIHDLQPAQVRFDPNHIKKTAKAGSRPLSTAVGVVSVNGSNEISTGLKSPAASSTCTTETPLSQGSIPILSEEAMGNAAFLFSPSYMGNDKASSEQMRLAPPAGVMHRDHASSFALSTFDSRCRVSGSSLSTKPVAIRPLHNVVDDSGSNRSYHTNSKTVWSIDEAPKEGSDVGKRNSSITTYDDTMRGKFASKESQKFEMPQIVHALSDLTDTTGRESGMGTSTRKEQERASRVSPIPEVSIRHGGNILDREEEEEDMEIFESESSDENVVGPTATWTYRADGEKSGVTPFRSGVSVKYATNSPFLRFQDAKTKFTGGPSADEPTEDFEDPEAPNTVQRVTGGGLVSSRIAAMEQRAAAAGVSGPLGNSGKVVPRKVRRATTGRKALAPRRAKLVSPLFRRNHQNDGKFHDEKGLLQSDSEDVSLGNDEGLVNKRKHPSSPTQFEKSPTLVNGQVVDSSKNRSTASLRVQTEHVKMSDVSADFTGDKEHEEDDMHSFGTQSFGRIMHPTTIDEDSESGASRGFINHLFPSQPSQCETEGEAASESESDDEFAILLNQADGEDDDDTVSTVRQNRQYPSLSKLHGSRPSYRVSFSDSSTVESCSVATVRRQRLSGSSTVEATKRLAMKATSQSSLLGPFREEAPVKPNEQNAPTAPGSLHLSPMQRTPMQARKWRALAAAAQEKDSKRNLSAKTKIAARGRRSLAERNPNVMGY
jgi:hypothetical protein